MNRLLLFCSTSVLLTLFALSSCGSDDDGGPPPHIVGDWEFDSFILSNVPSAYSNNEGAILAIDQISFGGSAIESYGIEFIADGRFDRSIGVLGPDLNDEGTWVLEDDELTLDSDDIDDDEIFDVEKNEDDQLWLSVEVQFSLLPNAVADTLTNEYYNGLSNEDKDALFDVVSLDLVYAFKK